MTKNEILSLIDRSLFASPGYTDSDGKGELSKEEMSGTGKFENGYNRSNG